jgi:hypothetical protein
MKEASCSAHFKKFTPFTEIVFLHTSTAKNFDYAIYIPKFFLLAHAEK